MAWALRYSITSGTRCWCHLGIATVQHNFRRTPLVPSREENISSLGTAVQHNFRRTLLVPSREENIKRISIAWAPRYSRARNQAKIPEGVKSFTMKPTRQGSNDGEQAYSYFSIFTVCFRLGWPEWNGIVHMGMALWPATGTDTLTPRKKQVDAAHWYIPTYHYAYSIPYGY